MVLDGSRAASLRLFDARAPEDERAERLLEESREQPAEEDRERQRDGGASRPLPTPDHPGEVAI